MIIGTGIGGHNDIVEFNVTTNFWCNSCKDLEQTIDPRAGENVRIDKIPMLSLDTLLGMFQQPINFLKADIEGSELEAFLLCDEIQLAKVKNMAIAAYHMVDGKQTVDTIQYVLDNQGYKTIKECEPYNGFPGYTLVYATQEEWKC
jgi:hypothetical protein